MYSSSFRLTNRDIDLAFEANRMFLVCQPKLCLATGGMLGAEAYIRWNHPDYGLLPPGLFLSFIERRERSGELTRFVARAAAETLVRCQQAGDTWPLSINLGAPDLADMGLPGALDGIMAEYGLDPASLILEVPEGAFARHAVEAAQTLIALRRLGFRTALDGGGAVIVPDDVLTPDYFDEVKIGGASIIQFARRLKQSGLGFVGKRVALAASRGLGATAVGVEDATTLAALSSLGFTAAQGALICRPSDPAELAGWSAPAEVLAAMKHGKEGDDEILLLTDPLPESAPENIEEAAEEREAKTEEASAEEAPRDEDSQAGEEPPIELIVEEETYTEEVLETAPALPAEPPAPVVEYSWEEVDPMIPAGEVRGVAWRIDRVCLFPDRHLVALIRRPRVLPHMRKEKTRRKTAKKVATIEKAAPRKTELRRPPPRKRKTAPAGLVTRPSLLQLALGF
ncbi:EAL domain-containing protein [Parvibaculum sp.]|uniref:EAL domain-containing protein n=2 Tax=Parvibaculum sp. TaxID=2024848 RepID=UPI001B1BD580|nr:EAL domain-containing protein [Parvibaculum sp.]MBO6634610.1 EAL domain-containing protein [Parvibaculum sp.]MBO6680035.1 EAL domain-containing protein [Parvibaculum sp.]MBO6905160.1 EAL domain-containing protein [Parvibaculum sp.]